MDNKSPHPYLASSPNTNSNSNSNSNGAVSASLPPAPKSPIPNAPYPTTFVQADTQSFKQVVQMLTGSAETAAKRAAAAANPPIKNHPLNNRAKKPAFKLYERRPSMKNLKMIGPLVPSSLANQNSPSAASTMMRALPVSPSVLDFPSLALSPVTPLDMAAATTPEERAITEKGYYLHPSPRPPATTPGGSDPPRLLPLFPLTSPRD